MDHCIRLASPPIICIIYWFCLTEGPLYYHIWMLLTLVVLIERYNSIPYEEHWCLLRLWNWDIAHLLLKYHIYHFWRAELISPLITTIQAALIWVLYATYQNWEISRMNTDVFTIIMSIRSFWTWLVYFVEALIVFFIFKVGWNIMYF